MSPLVEVIRKEIEKRGVVSFARFMERALYEPELGYYETEVALGRAGDFYTNVSVGPLFGELLAFQFATWLDGSADEISIVEAGAHDGTLAADVLGYLQQFQEGLLERVEYVIVEPSAVRREWQVATLESFLDHVRWVDDLGDLGEDKVRGVVFCNELLDAFPVHRLGWDVSASEWFEWGVAWGGDGFAWERMEEAELKAVRSQTLQVPRELREALPDGFVTVACPRAAKWWTTAANCLNQGRLLTIDYGMEAEAFFAPERVNGTLRAFHRHQVLGDLLADVGRQDITSSANFTVLRSMGELAFLVSHPLRTQEKFLMEIFRRTLKRPGQFPEWSPERKRQFQTLTHPEHLGRPFRVLVQERG